LGVKSAIVPLHTWLPDAHGWAPSSISAMLSGIIVQSAFYALLKVSLGLGFPAHDLGTLLIVLSLLNMTLGNGMALVQTYTKRLLAYSTIAQMGYVMLSVGVGLRYDVPLAIQAGFFLLLAHAAMKGVAFLCKGVCHFYCDATRIEDLRGTAMRLPLVAVVFSVALAGLAGVPPLRSNFSNAQRAATGSRLGASTGSRWTATRHRSMPARSSPSRSAISFTSSGNCQRHGRAKIPKCWSWRQWRVTSPRCCVGLSVTYFPITTSTSPNGRTRASCRAPTEFSISTSISITLSSF